MREMKDSGIYDIDYVPIDWTVKSLKYVCTMQSGDNLTAQEIEDDDDFPVYGGNGLRGYYSKYNTNGMHVLIGRQGALCGNIHVVAGRFWATDHAVVVNNDATVDTRYFGYLLQTMNLNQYSVTAAQPGLSVDKIIKLKGCFPLLSEQKRIANFLDSKCAEIDALSADIQSEIETLEAYKRSVITEVVTKGLDKNVPMKDSGIEWVGEIPATWDVHPVYYYFGERKNKNYALQERNLLSLSYGKIIRKDIDTVGGLLPASFNTYNIVEAGDIIIRPTDLQNDKRSLRTGLVHEKGIITSAYIDLAPKKNINPYYFHYLLHSYDVQKVFYNMGNGVRQGLNYSEFAKLMIFAPSRKEQDEIVSYLGDTCAEIESVIAQKQEQLAVLAEYKKSVIYEYVTGKKEVPAS